MKKKRPELEDEESDLDDDFIKRHLIALEKKEEERLDKLLVKENEKRVAAGESPLKSLPEKSRKAPVLTLERLEKKLVTLTERIASQKMQLVDKVIFNLITRMKTNRLLWALAKLIILILESLLRGATSIPFLWKKCLQKPCVINSSGRWIPSPTLSFKI